MHLAATASGSNAVPARGGGVASPTSLSDQKSVAAVPPEPGFVVGPGCYCNASLSFGKLPYWRSLRIVCGTAFACASMAVPACKRIWFLVKFTISSDMSVSMICDSDADKFWLVT